MSPKAIAVAGVSALAIAASGCGGDSDPEAEFRAAFEKEFSAAPWYHHITGMELTDEGGLILDIATDLHPPDIVPENHPAFMICHAAMGFALDHDVGDGIRGVSVSGSDGVGGMGCA